MRDLFEKTKIELKQQEKDWFRLEVTDCLKSAECLAVRPAEASSREQAISEVESRYATLSRMTSGPAGTRGLTIKSKQELMGSMERLRQLVLRLRGAPETAVIRPANAR